MKLVTPEEMGRVEKKAYDSGSSEEAFMETAGGGVAEVVEAFIASNGLMRSLCLLCGKGNNSGDAYVVGRLLLGKGYQVEALQLAPLQDSSVLCQKMAGRFHEAGGQIKTVASGLSTLSFTDGVIVDGLFGTGFYGQAQGLYGQAIDWANSQSAPTIAVDTPSGLNGKDGEVKGPVIHAQQTVCLGFPKIGCFLQEGPNYTGDLIRKQFGLSHSYCKEVQAEAEWLQAEDVRSLFPEIRRTRHKYEAGHLLLIAGSPGMPGAAMLAGLAALRTGAGVVRLLHPAGMEEELASAPYEVIRYGYNGIDEVKRWASSASAIMVGPGLGREPKTAGLIEALLDDLKTPLVLDADALYWIAEKGLSPPEGALLTPHMGEMHRLLGRKSKSSLTPSFMQECQQYVETHRVVVLLKGATTCIFSPGNLCRVSNRGGPGMATAGSGDVLSGLLGALLAQSTTPLNAALLGAFLHGVAGELATARLNPYSLIASDLVDSLPKAIDSLLG
jgi:hydroxyethylthiazole kinase-like uncharacterized protein yjeF